MTKLQTFGTQFHWIKGTIRAWAFILRNEQSKYLTPEQRTAWVDAYHAVNNLHNVLDYKKAKVNFMKENK